MANLGVIGGLGPGATTQYYRELAKKQVGEMLIVHADVALVLAAAERGDRLGLAEYFARLIERLAAGGATYAAISATTPHICIKELQKISVLPLVNIVEVVSNEIRNRQYKKVALFGTKFVMQSKMFGLLESVEVIVPGQSEIIHQTYLQIVGGKTAGANALLTQIARQLPVDAIILAGTDLSLVFDETNTDFPHIDCLKLHVEAIAQFQHSAA